MQGELTPQDMERVLARAIDLDAGSGLDRLDRDTILLAGAELDIDDGAIRQALLEHEVSTASRSVIDRLLGPGTVAAAGRYAEPSPMVKAGVELFMLRKRLTPANRADTWLQQRGRWPDRHADNSVPAVTAKVRDAGQGSEAVLVARLDDARSGYVMGFVVVVMTAVLLTVVIPIWGAVVGAVLALWAAVATRIGYRRHVTSTADGLRSSFAEIASHAARLGAPGALERRPSDDAAGVLVDRRAVQDPLRAEA